MIDSALLREVAEEHHQRLRARPADAPERRLHDCKWCRITDVVIPRPRQSPEDIRYRVHAHDRDQQAVLAVSCPEGKGLGAARYVRCSDDHESADVSVAVLDEWQGKGLATELLSRIADRARGQGIRRLTAKLRPDNVRAIRLVGKAGTAATLVGQDGDGLFYEIALHPMAADRVSA